MHIGMAKRNRSMSNNVQDRIAFFQLSEPITSSKHDNTINDDPFDSNNNVVSKTSLPHSEALPNGRASSSESKSNNQQPCYVPSYVRTVSFECNRRPSSESSNSPKERISRTVSLNRCTAHRRRDSGSSQSYGHYGPCKDLALLREKYRKPSIPEIRVRSAVAAMESRIDPVLNPSTKVVKSSIKPSYMKPKTAPKPIIRPKDPVAAITLQRKAKHRRSMSDPNLTKTFGQIKQMWNQKSESEKQPASESPPNDGISSINSVGNSKSLDRKSLRKGSIENKELNKNILPKVNSPSITVDPPAKTNMARSLVAKEPIVPPKPSGRKQSRGRPDILANNNVPEACPTPTLNDETSSEVTLQTKGNLSVSEKARLFGGLKRKSVASEEKQDSKKQPGPPSPAFQRHRVSSWSDDSTNQSIDSEKDQSATESASPFSCIPQRNNNYVTKVQKHIPHRRDEEEKKTVTPLLQKNVSLVKNRSMKEKNEESSATDDDEDIERGKRKGSFLHSMRRGSRDSVKSSKEVSPAQSPLFVKKLANPSITTDVSVESNDALESDFKGRRRSSSLQRIMQQKLSSNSPGKSSMASDTKSPALNTSSSTHTKGAKVTEKSHSELAPRPTDLPLLLRERSLTEGYRQRNNNVSKIDRQRTGSGNKLNKLLSKSDSNESIESSTPDKRSSGFSDGEPSPVRHVPIRPTRPAPPPPTTKLNTSRTEAIPRTTQSETASLSSVDSSSTISTSRNRLSTLNLLEEYDKIAKEVNDDDEMTDIRTRPISQDLSIESVDSGFRNSLEVPSSTQGVNTDGWSDLDNSDEDNFLAGHLPPELSRAPSPGANLKEPNEIKLYNIAKELLSTEGSYVAVLHLIDQVFHKQVREAAVSKHIIPEQIVNNIFCHVPAIYQFHSSFLLPHLQERLQNWETTPKIGDIMTQAAPYFKMYSLYVQNFDDAMKKIKLWSEKSKEFSAVLKIIQQTPECNFLTLQHHMLSPVQRVPRYRLLLEDYLKRLPEDAEDRADAETALKLITVAATHNNETMKRIENFQKLVSISNMLVDANFEIVDVTRLFLKEGKIIKISARNGEKHERYIYLFSDMLLCCSSRRLQGKSHKVTAKIDLDGMKITDVKNPTVPFAFRVDGLQKSMEFATHTSEENEVWVQAIQNAIDKRKDRLPTLLTTPNGPIPGSPFPPSSPIHHCKQQPATDITDAELGKRAPRWTRDNEVTMCMCCSKAFSKLLRRRHHCRACGKVVCSECSEQKMNLQYDPGKPLKICLACYNVLTGRHQSDSTDGEKKGVLEVEADEVSGKSVLADYLYFTENEKKRAWTKTWCVIPNDELCLYFYGAHQDVRAQMTMPLPGFKVIDLFFTDHRHCFKLMQGKKVFLFASDDEQCIDRWKYALTQASRGEDLTREDVYLLGRAPEKHECSSENSDDSQEDGEETLQVIANELSGNEGGSYDEESEEEESPLASEEEPHLED